MKKKIAIIMAAMALANPVAGTVAKTLPIKVLHETNSNKFWNQIKHRKGKLIISYCTGTVLNNKGDGRTDYFPKNHDYISYKYTDGVHKGDKVMSVFLWNPDTNYVDDTIGRYDFITYCPHGGK